MNPDKKETQNGDQASGRYVNYFKIGHNAFEFVLDFGQIYEEGRPASLHTRIVTAPVYAKSLLGVLRESIEQYEQLFGPIPNGDK